MIIKQKTKFAYNLHYKFLNNFMKKKKKRWPIGKVKKENYI